MSKQSRRKFISKAGQVALAAGLTTFATNQAFSMTDKKEVFVHHVYFWLKNPNSKEDKAKLVEGLNTLTKIRTIRMAHIGQPADTNREVIDRSYAISWLLLFDSKADEEVYQVDPVHQAFVTNYSHLWSKVVVYDSVPV